MGKVSWPWIVAGFLAAVVAGGFWLGLDFSTDAVLKIPATVFVIIAVIVIPIFMEVPRDEKKGYYLGLFLGGLAVLLSVLPHDERLRVIDGVAPRPPEAQR